MQDSPLIGVTTPPDKTRFRDAMAHLSAAVNIITSDGAGGRVGFTASAVCSVTDEPPTLLVCLNRSASVYDAINANGVLCVNVLADGHQGLSALFGGKTPASERFAQARWSTLATGAPVLEGAVASFDCVIAGRTALGSHDVLHCRVLDIARAPHAPRGLVYFARAYHALSALAPS